VKFYHAIRLGNGNLIYCPTSIKENLFAHAPTSHLLNEDAMKMIKLKETISHLKAKI
jgi:hypothetical protein